MNKSLANVALLGQLPEHNAQQPANPLFGAILRPSSFRKGLQKNREITPVSCPRSTRGPQGHPRQANLSR